ncbi:MAG: hypothetical protein EHM20_03105 [Alphaproteobacteria bacterium]|nr:MAG: hypothetical protein EHM20_03105 [Alphaproteobacteria bacterium]
MQCGKQENILITIPKKNAPKKKQRNNTPKKKQKNNTPKKKQKNNTPKKKQRKNTPKKKTEGEHAEERIEEIRMKKYAEKPSTLTATLYIICFIMCGYFIIKTILTI